MDLARHTDDRLIIYCQLIVEEWFRAVFRPPFTRMLQVNDPERCPFPCLVLNSAQRLAYPRLAYSIRFGEGHAGSSRGVLYAILRQAETELTSPLATELTTHQLEGEYAQ